ncbi:UPF0481 protein At3g47200-like isoform X2 [Salvia splendens]|uniref:UPF0481 protein At3g47200-like isoform X2 n=1 Tax=Salvia splendens TaxID=180675 RepID=UPI001C2800E5|nr:UPF0481 protein At3g47200-like isoform X2 [Salvia splendens]
MRSHSQEMRSEDENSQTKLIEILISSFDQKLDKLSADPSYSYAACIYKVSDKLRKANEGSYTPRLVSIGPLHCDRVQLQGMEAYKLKFMNNFLSRFGIDLHALVKFATREESFVRGCYEGKIHLSPKQLIEVILLDGIFIVELFLENYFIQLRDRNEIIFQHPYMHNDLLHDMMLLENQLPISIMENLLSFVDLSFIHKGKVLTIYHLAHKFFKYVGNTYKVPLTTNCCKARHFVEFLLILHDAPPIKPGSVSGPGSLRKKLSPNSKLEYTRRASELQEAGVKFSSGEGDCLFEVLFAKDKGELKIPKLTVNASTETFFRNLIAFEQLGHVGYYSKNITSYVILMDSLIDTPDDVDILVGKGIIENKLGNSQHIANLFNNLYKEVVTEATDFYFAELCGELNKYRKDRLHQWRAKCFTWRRMLKRNYFSNPWSFLSVLAAAVLLILTIIQTVCSILQV